MGRKCTLTPPPFYLFFCPNECSKQERWVTSILTSCVHRNCVVKLMSICSLGLQSWLPLLLRQTQTKNKPSNRIEAMSRLNWTRHTRQERQQTLQPSVTEVEGTPRSRPCTDACSTSSASVPSQIVLSAMVCLHAVFHYPASDSAPLQDWSHLNMPRHHLLLNGPLWSKCQPRKLLRKTCSHLFKLTFSIETHASTFSLFFILCLLMAESLTKGPVLPSLRITFTAHEHLHYICVRSHTSSPSFCAGDE